MPSRRKTRAAAAKRRTRLLKPGPQQKGSRPTPGEAFQALVALQMRLLAPGGCPWDREQTHQSLRRYLLEETYEVLDALESGDSEKFAEELGDLLLQVIFHAQLAQQQGRFDIVDVIEHVHAKLVRRHPHVFGDVQAETSGEVLKHWEQIKTEERRAGRAEGENTAASLLDGVPAGLPALMEADQLTRRAARVGFDWEDAAAVLRKLREEAAELGTEIAHPGGSAEEEAGDLLFAAANMARFLKLDPEIALRQANQKFARRFREMEAVAKSQGRTLGEMTAAEMDQLWESVKRHDVEHPEHAKQPPARR
jgi:tetrapyrrole methylase family protein / MazG family protein